MMLAFRILLAAFAVCQFVCKVTISTNAVDISKVPDTWPFATKTNNNRPPGPASTTPAYIHAEGEGSSAQYDQMYRWFTSELESGGRLNRREIDFTSGSGTPMTVSFAYYTNGATYYFGQGKTSDNHGVWRIRELLPGGEVSRWSTDGGLFLRYYGAVFPFYIGERAFLFAHSEVENVWNIHELLPGGVLNRNPSDGGTWSRYYGALFPFYIGGKVYLFGHTDNGFRWGIQELLPGGILSRPETDSGTWSRYYGALLPFYVGGKAYLFGHTDNGYR